MYQHNGLVSTALALMFQLSMTRSETTALLQEVHLLQFPDMVTLYHEACSHAVQLQNFFANKSNLRGQWCEKMLTELEWFMPKLNLPTRPPSPPCSPTPDGRAPSPPTEARATSEPQALVPPQSVAEMQDILRNLKMHQIAISILEATADDPAAASKMNSSLYNFLIGFCKQSAKNQAALYTDKSLHLFTRQVRRASPPRPPFKGPQARGGAATCVYSPIRLLLWLAKHVLRLLSICCPHLGNPQTAWLMDPF